MTGRTVLLPLLFTLFIPVKSLAGQAEKEAVEAAQAWLKLVDKGDYAKSWEEAAPFLQAAVSKDDWTKSLRRALSPLGAVGSRTVQSALYTKTLPGAPDGEYVVIQFSTTFANKKSAVETVTPSKGLDGRWKVSGYYVR